MSKWSHIPKLCIYGLADPNTEVVHYIGKTVRGIDRISAHWTPSVLKKDRTNKGRWLRSLRRRSLFPKVVVLETSRTRDMYDLERKWIARGKRRGWPLTNMTAGGVGLYRHAFTQEHRDKISRALKGRKIPNWQRRLISLAQRGRKMPRVTRIAIRKSRFGSHHSPETRAKIGAAHRGKHYGPTTRAKVSAANSLPIRELRSGQVFKSRIEASEALGVCTRSITRAAKGHISSVRGFRFSYAKKRVG